MSTNSKDNKNNLVVKETSVGELAKGKKERKKGWKNDI